MSDAAFEIPPVPSAESIAFHVRVYKCVVALYMRHGLVMREGTKLNERETYKRTILVLSTSTDAAIEQAKERVYIFAPMNGNVEGVEVLECTGFPFPYRLPDPAPVVNIKVNKTGNNRPKSKRRR